MYVVFNLSTSLLITYCTEIQRFRTTEILTQSIQTCRFKVSFFGLLEQRASVSNRPGLESRFHPSLISYVTLATQLTSFDLHFSKCEMGIIIMIITTPGGCCEIIYETVGLVHCRNSGCVSLTFHWSCSVSDRLSSLCYSLI